MFAGSALHVLGGVVFFALLAWACASDLRARRIPNLVVVLLAASGVLFSVSVRPFPQSLGHTLGGLGLGLAMWLPFWLLRMLGAGDVKLFAAAAAWLGPSLAFEGALLTALFGGVLSLAYMLAGHGFSFTLLRLGHAMREPEVLRESLPSRLPARMPRMPYGLAIAFGAGVAALLPGILL